MCKNAFKDSHLFCSVPEHSYKLSATEFVHLKTPFREVIHTLLSEKGSGMHRNIFKVLKPDSEAREDLRDLFCNPKKLFQAKNSRLGVKTKSFAVKNSISHKCTILESVVQKRDTKIAC